eukprot:5641217-Amphidinium_carterae.1
MSLGSDTDMHASRDSEIPKKVLSRKASRQGNFLFRSYVTLGTSWPCPGNIRARGKALELSFKLPPFDFSCGA